MRGAEAGLKDMGQLIVARTSYKRGATDFSSQIEKLRSENVDLVVLATVVRESIGAVAEARKNGWNVDMLGSIPTYSPEVPELGGRAMEGLYSVSPFALPYPDSGNARLTAWINDYKRRFNAEPKLGSVMGYTVADLFVKALEKAGPNVTAETVSVALESLNVARDFLGNPPYQFSPNNHLGNRLGRINQVRNGRWEHLTDFLKD